MLSERGIAALQKKEGGHSIAGMRLLYQDMQYECGLTLAFGGVEDPAEMGQMSAIRNLDMIIERGEGIGEASVSNESIN